MKPFAAVALVLLLFVTGVLVGVVGTHAFYAHHLQEPDRLIDFGARWHVQRLQRELDLTAEQEEKMQELVAATRDEIRTLQEGFMPEVRARVTDAHEEFVGVLSPEQRERLHEIMRRQNRRYFRAFGFPHGAERSHGETFRHRRHGRRPPHRGSGDERSSGSTRDVPESDSESPRGSRESS